MLPRNYEELNRIRRECYRIVTQRAALSGAAAAVPIPGVDIAADIGLLMQLIPEINRRFGLDPSQIDQYDIQTKMLIYNLVMNMSARLAGQFITKQLIISMLKKVGVRVAAKQVTKFIPFIGPILTGTLSFTVMKLLCDSHVNECYDVVKAFLDNNSDSDDGDAATV
jgi:uncharacterized protein (DUF697 family)